MLLNQCPHNLDQLYWITGLMPKRITAVAHLGKTHPIEVEDEVSAILEKTKAKQWGFRSLLHEIVRSRLFLEK